jgi:hypothetical protein
MTPLTLLTPLAGSGSTDRGDAPRVEAKERRREIVTSSLKEDIDTGPAGKEVKGSRRSRSQPPSLTWTDCHLPAPSRSWRRRSGMPAICPPRSGSPLSLARQNLPRHPTFGLSPPSRHAVAQSRSHYYTIGSTAFGVWVRSRVMTIKSRPAVQPASTWRAHEHDPVRFRSRR